MGKLREDWIARVKSDWESFVDEQGGKLFFYNTERKLVLELGCSLGTARKLRWIVEDVASRATASHKSVVV